MKAGDLVKARNVNTPSRIGFIIKVEERHCGGLMFAFVRFTDKGNGYWYHPAKLEVISEICLNGSKND